jgi:hypothetical protein
MASMLGRLAILAAVALPLVALGHGMTEADRQLLVDGGYAQFVWLGAKHMVTGYDHLLFILGVIFFLTGFRDIVKYIPAFTIGHSITLLGATLLGITANEHAVDAVIALSVCYKGFENVGGFRKYLGIEAPNLLAVVFLFGLVHGFGLATRLQQLPLGQDDLVARILCFNVGVELGQIAALIFMVQAIALWRRRDSFQQFSITSNGGLIAAGLLLFAVQSHAFMHTAYPDAHGFAGDLHHHAHEDMDADFRATLRDDIREVTEAEPHEHPHEHPHGSSE